MFHSSDAPLAATHGERKIKHSPVDPLCFCTGDDFPVIGARLP